MSDEKNKPGKSGAAKPPVIDVKAKKVGEEKTDKADKLAADAKAPKPEKAAPDAARDKAGDKKSEGDGKKSAPKAEDTAAKKDAPESAPKPEPAKPRKKGGGWFWKGLFGLLLLGGAAGGGAWLYQQYGPEKKLAAVQARLAALERKAAGADLKALAQRIDALETAQRKIASQVDKLATLGALPQKVATLEKRIGAAEALRQQVRANAEAVQRLNDALAKTQEQLTTLKEGIAQMAQPSAGVANAMGAQAPANAAAPAAALLALKLSLKETQQKLADLARQLSEVRKAADPARMEMLEGRLKKHEEALLRLRSELQENIDKAMQRALRAEKAARAAGAAVADLKAHPPTPEIAPPPAAMAYAALREKAKAGKPFAEELKKLAALLPGARPLDALAPYAETGAPTAAALSRLLDEAIARMQQQASAASGSGKNGGVLGALKQRLSKVVKVRRAGEVDWPALARRMRDELAKGGVGAALAAMPERAGKLPQPLAAWVSKARARQRVDAALDALADLVLRQARGK